jgi:hypothetical protein
MKIFRIRSPQFFWANNTTRCDFATSVFGSLPLGLLVLSLFSHSTVVAWRAADLSSRRRAIWWRLDNAALYNPTLSSESKQRSHVRQELFAARSYYEFGATARSITMKRILIAAAACTLSLVGIESASAQALIVEDAYAAPVYELPPTVPYYAAPVVVTPASAYAAPVPAYPIFRERPITREVVVTEPEITWDAAPGVIYSAW